MENIRKKMGKLCPEKWDFVKKNIAILTDAGLFTRPLVWTAYDKNAYGIVEIIDKQFKNVSPELTGVVEEIRETCEYISAAQTRMFMFS